MEFLKTLARATESAFNLGTTPTVSRLNLHSRSLMSTIGYLADPLDAVHIAIVMELMIDELEVLGATIACPKPDLRSAESLLMDKKLHGPQYTPLPVEEGVRRKEAFTLDQHYTSCLPRRMMQSLDPVEFWSFTNLRDVMVGAKVKTTTPAGKFQMHRTFLQMIAENLMREVLEKSTFDTLNYVIKEEKEMLRNFWTMCIKIAHNQLKIYRLKKDIKFVKNEKKIRVAELDAEIFKLTDNVLELSKRSDMEKNLAQKQAKMIVKRFKRKHRHIMNDNHAQIALMQKKIVFESIVHADMYTYLTKVVKETQYLHDYWTEKYEIDLAALTNQLEELIRKRAHDLARAEWLTKMIKRWEPIVIEDRRLKQIEDDKRARKEIEYRRATLLTAWWRGTMVRRRLGRFAPVKEKPKKEKKKKGK